MGSLRSHKIRYGMAVTLCAVATLGAASLLAAGGASGSVATSGSPKAATPFKACLVADIGGIDDHGFNQYSWGGVVAAEHADSAVTGKYLETETSSDYAPDILAFVHAGCGIIVTVGFDQATATELSAKQNPKQKYAIVDYTYSPNLSNVDGIHYDTDQAAFLGGYLAAAVSKSHVVGTCGGEDIPTVTIYMSGFVAGVRYYDKVNHATVKVLGWNPNKNTGLFTNSFTSQTAGELDAKSLMSSGADVIFSVACGPEGAAAAIKAAGPPHYMEWVDVDGCSAVPQYCSIFITSVEKGLTQSVESVVLEAAHGSFKGGVNYNGTLANSGVGIAPFHDFAGKIPSSVQAALKTIRAGIIAGRISVNPLAYPVGPAS